MVKFKLMDTIVCLLFCSYRFINFVVAMQNQTNWKFMLNDMSSDCKGRCNMNTKRKKNKGKKMIYTTYTKTCTWVVLMIAKAWVVNTWLWYSKA